MPTEQQLRQEIAWLKQENEALANRMAARHLVLEHLPEPLFMLDHQLCVLRANFAGYRLFGDDIQEKPLRHCIDEPEVHRCISEALRTETQQQTTLTLRHPLRYYTILAQPVPIKTAVQTRLVVTLHDVTEILISRQAATDFVANASHELRTPLTSILGFIETLQGPAANDALVRQQFFDIMHEQATRMARLINDLLSLSAIERTLAASPEDYLALIPLLEDSVEAFHLKAKSRDVQMDVQLLNEAITVKADADQLLQVFHNLLDNAIKYTELNGTVTVTVQKTDKNVTVMVKNTGQGITPEDIQRLGERFYRTASARSRGITGTGLGLAIVKNIVDRHQGQLVIDSVLGQYTSFSVVLPISS